MILSNSVDIDITNCSQAVLAYIGDAVLELYVRQRLIEDSNMSVNELHKKATITVSAKGEANAFFALKKMLCPEEITIVKRGRNAGVGNVPKNSTVAQYRTATGLECLIGTLYVKNETIRLEEILKMCFEWTQTAKGDEVPNENL